MIGRPGISGGMGHHMLFFSTRLGCLGSLAVTLVLTWVAFLILNR